MVRADKDPTTFKVLEESEFRKIYPRKDKIPGGLGQDKSPALSRKAEREKELLERAARFDEGGSHPVDW